MESGNGAWNWSSLTSAYQQQQNREQGYDHGQGHGTGQGNVQVITMDWRDILGSAQAQGGSVTSSTSPFVFPPADGGRQGGGGHLTSGYYTGQGVRQEVEGQQPATFRIAVGNPGDLGQFMSQGQGSGGGQQGSSPGSGDSGGSGVTSGPRVVMLPTPKLPVYQPCGKCEACSYTGSKVKKGSNYLCRTSPQ